MPYLSPALNVMIAAARKAGRGLIRDFGELENLQISRKEMDFQGCDPVICSKTALKAFDAIISQGEGAAQENADSHYARFIAIREEFKAPGAQRRARVARE